MSSTRTRRWWSSVFPDFDTRVASNGSDYLVFRWHTKADYDEFLADLAHIANALEACGESGLASDVRKCAEGSFISSIADNRGCGYNWSWSVMSFDGRGEFMLRALAQSAIAFSEHVMLE